jgi:hypothetical protein
MHTAHVVGNELDRRRAAARFLRNVCLASICMQRISFCGGDRAARPPCYSAEVVLGTGRSAARGGPTSTQQCRLSVGNELDRRRAAARFLRKVCLPSICMRRISFAVLAIVLPGALIVGGGRRPAANGARAFAQALGRDFRTAIIRDHLERPETPERGPTTLIDHMKARGRGSDDSSTVECRARNPSRRHELSRQIPAPRPRDLRGAAAARAPLSIARASLAGVLPRRPARLQRLAPPPAARTWTPWDSRRPPRPRANGNFASSA